MKKKSPAPAAVGQLAPAAGGGGRPLGRRPWPLAAARVPGGLGMLVAGGAGEGGAQQHNKKVVTGVEWSVLCQCLQQHTSGRGRAPIGCRAAPGRDWRRAIDAAARAAPAPGGIQHPCLRRPPAAPGPTPPIRDQLP